MMKNDVYTIRELQWDTDYFGVTCAKVILHKRLTLAEWIEIKEEIHQYQFISLENRNSDPTNAQLIGESTAAFLADINVQFMKKIDKVCRESPNIKIYKALKRDERVIEMAQFPFSKFTDDPEFAKREGDQVYCQWLINSFEKPEKFFALSENANGAVNGFLLHSYSDRSCIIELIAVSGNEHRNGVGSNLFKAIEYAAHQLECNEIRVGTQVKNMNAINFYYKVGCRLIACHQVYHMWNL